MIGNKRIAAAVAATLMSGACSGGGGAGNGAQSQAQNNAETLRNAAAQSTPEARQVLENAANQVESQNISTPPGAPGSPVQEAMEKAGNAAAAPPPVARQAVPRQPGEQSPPRTTPTPPSQ